MQYTNIVFACSLMNWCKSVCKKLMSQNQLLSVLQIVSESVMATNSCQPVMSHNRTIVELYKIVQPYCHI